MKKTFYITTAIDYVNSLPHIGTAYEKICADAIARYRRLAGYDVRFLMGNDEHSVNVKKRSEEEDLSPKEYCDRMEKEFRVIWSKLNISFDDFIRTTGRRHKIAVTKLFKSIKDAGDIYMADYEGYYCEGCERFLTEKDLDDGVCPNHKTKPSWIKETNFFFRLSKYADKLLDHIKKNPDFILPETRRNEIINVIEGGLEDISVSRSSFDWGIPVPDKPDHVIYVWFDALINYISGLGFGGEDKLFKKYWPADIHVIGKDITRFHCIIWPAMLMSAGVELPKTIHGHGFIHFKGEKLSKSLGNIVNPLEIVETYGADPLRFFFLRETAYGQDGDFSWERFIERYNADLANDLGNLLSRTLNMILNTFKTILPQNETLPGDGPSSQIDMIIKKYQEAMDRYELNSALEVIWNHIRRTNRYIEETAPFRLAKDISKRDQLEKILRELCQSLRITSVLLWPFIPDSAERIYKDIGLSGDIAGNIEKDIEGLENLKDYRPFGKIPTSFEALFPRIEQRKKEKARKSIKATESDESSPVLEFDEFAKMDLRVGTILSCEKVEGADRLLKLSVDIGEEKRELVAGLARKYNPGELEGKQVIVVTNLAPRKIRGLVSQGMVLAAVDGDVLSLIIPDKSIVPGSRVS